MSFVVNTRYQVLTRAGWKDFSGVKRSSCDQLFVIETNVGLLKGTPEHKVLKSTGEFCTLSKLNIGDVLFGAAVVTSIDVIEGDNVVYDLINVDDGHEYITNGITSKNCAFIRDFDEIWTGLYPTVSEGGSAILISTPNGVGGLYHQLWIDGAAGVNEFNTIKLPWHVHPEHNQAWFDKESRNFSKRGIAQEFMCDFVSSGDTFLQPGDMDYCQHLLKPPVRREGPGSNVWIWTDPEPSKRYVISADVARGDSADFSTFHIINYETVEVVGEFMGKVPPDKLAELMIEYGQMYNTALLCPERNTFGYFTCVKLREHGYKRLYYKDAPGDAFNYMPRNGDTLPGFDTTPATRPQILGKLEEMIRNKTLKSYSQRTFDQFQSFVWRGQRAQALRSGHDDLVMSLAIGAWLIGGTQSSSVVSADLAVAILNASSVSRRDHSSVFNDINSVGPIKNGLYGVNHNNVYKPVQADANKTYGNLNFNWLLG